MYPYYRPYGYYGYMCPCPSYFHDDYYFWDRYRYHRPYPYYRRAWW